MVNAQSNGVECTSTQQPRQFILDDQLTAQSDRIGKLGSTDEQYQIQKPQINYETAQGTRANETCQQLWHGPKRLRKLIDKFYPDFPLQVHSQGLYRKKVDGKQYYFGKWGTQADGVILILTAV